MTLLLLTPTTRTFGLHNVLHKICVKNDLLFTKPLYTVPRYRTAKHHNIDKLGVTYERF